LVLSTVCPRFTRVIFGIQSTQVHMARRRVTVVTRICPEEESNTGYALLGAQVDLRGAQVDLRGAQVGTAWKSSGHCVEDRWARRGRAWIFLSFPSRSWCSVKRIYNCRLPHQEPNMITARLVLKNNFAAVGR
jgi:hypothetical protein